jgi:hypothetical protein
MDQKEQRVFTFKLTQFIWLVAGLAEGLIGLRVLLRLMGANPENPFAVVVYGITRPLLWPFTTLTSQPNVGSYVLEIGSVIAMLVYAMLAWVLVQGSMILLYPMRQPPPTVEDHRRE